MCGENSRLNAVIIRSRYDEVLALRMKLRERDRDLEESEHRTIRGGRLLDEALRRRSRSRTRRSSSSSGGGGMTRSTILATSIAMIGAESENAPSECFLLQHGPSSEMGRPDRSPREL